MDDVDLAVLAVDIYHVPVLPRPHAFGGIIRREGKKEGPAHHLDFVQIVGLMVEVLEGKSPYRGLAFAT